MILIAICYSEEMTYHAEASDKVDRDNVLDVWNAVCHKKDVEAEDIDEVLVVDGTTVLSYNREDYDMAEDNTDNDDDDAEEDEY